MERISIPLVASHPPINSNLQVPYHHLQAHTASQFWRHWQYSLSPSCFSYLSSPLSPFCINSSHLGVWTEAVRALRHSVWISAVQCSKPYSTVFCAVQCSVPRCAMSESVQTTVLQSVLHPCIAPKMLLLLLLHSTGLSTENCWQKQSFVCNITLACTLQCSADLRINFF